MFRKRITLTTQCIFLCATVFLVSFLIIKPTAAISNKPMGNQEKTIALSNGEINLFSQNNILFYDPSECENRSGISSGSCFKIDSSTSIQDFWYAEGCLNTGECSGGLYYAQGKPPKSDNGLVVTKNNPWVYNDTKVDDDWGGMQYIYAENYDIAKYEGAYTKMTPNGGNSTRKYYWIVLPDQAYSNGFGETYVATFENFSEPVYFIVFDTHACLHQSEDYCGQANANSDEVLIGKEFFGAFTKNAGSSTAVADIAGKLTSLCRIEGSGEVTVNSDASKMPSANSSSSSPTSSPSTPTLPNSAVSGSDITWIGDSYSTGAESIIRDIFPDITFGESTNDDNSYIQSCKFVEDDTTCGARPSMNPSGLKILQKIIDAGDLKPYLVFALGGNGGWSESSVNKFKDIMSSQPDTKVIFANNINKENNYAESNKRLEDLVNSNSNYFLADWVSVYDPTFLVSDGVHLTENGYEKWVGVISDALSNASDGSCISTGGEAIAKTAIDLAWPDRNHTATLKPEYKAAAENVGIDLAQDCGKYVATVVLTTGLDPDFPKVGTSNLSRHMNESDLWEKIENTGNESDLQPGDVFVVNKNGGAGASGHTFIYIGEGKVASASLDSRYGDTVSNLIFSDHRGAYEIFRINVSGSSNCDTNICSEEKDTTSNLSRGLTEAQAKKLAEYYNNGGGTLCGGSIRENCYSLSMWWLCNFTDISGEGENACAGYATGDQVVDCLKSRKNLKTGTEPKPFAIFSTTTFHGTIHTGVVVDVDKNGNIMTIEAAYGGWKDLGHGLARVFPYQSISGHNITFAYIDEHLDKTKLNEILGN